MLLSIWTANSQVGQLLVPEERDNTLGQRGRGRFMVGVRLHDCLFSVAEPDSAAIQIFY